MRVVESGDHCSGAPVGSVPVVGICADTNTAYVSAAIASDMYYSFLGLRIEKHPAERSVVDHAALRRGRLVEGIDPVDRGLQCVGGDMLEQGAVGVGDFLLGELGEQETLEMCALPH